MTNMEETLKQFLDKDISKCLYYPEYNSGVYEKFFKELKEKYFEKAMNNSWVFSEYYHNRAGELLGKGVIVAYEFGGMSDVRKFMKEITEKSIEMIINSEAVNAPVSKDIKEDNKKNFEEMLEMMKEEIKNIEKMLNEWE